jgi:hypothetical protein
MEIDGVVTVHGRYFYKTTESTVGAGSKLSGAVQKSKLDA